MTMSDTASSDLRRDLLAKRAVGGIGDALLDEEERLAETAAADVARAEAARAAHAASFLDLPTPDVPDAPARRPGELKYRLTLFLFPSILLVFVALYVTSLASGVLPEMALLRAGGASVVLAVLARVAVSILGDESRTLLNEQQIVAQARSEALKEKLLANLTAHATGNAMAGAENLVMADNAALAVAGDGGKE